VRILVLCLLSFHVCFGSEPALLSEWRQGTERAVLVHEDGQPVDEANPARPGESLRLLGSGFNDPTVLYVGKQQVEAQVLDSDSLRFTLPEEVAGSFLEIAVETSTGLTRALTFPVNRAEAGQLTAAEVNTLVLSAASAIDNPRVAVAVVDRGGRVLAIYRRPQATPDIVEDALSVARTGAFFSHNQAPLSSRTVRVISRENFPEVFPNAPAAALFGIENTNRGCDMNTLFLPGKAVPRPTNAAGTGFSKGIGTQPGGIPIYKDGQNVGGLGVAGIDPDHAEFAVVAATAGTPFFVPLPLPFPGAVFIDGIRLPFVTQTTRPPGTVAVSALTGGYQIGPLDGASIADGDLVSIKGTTDLSVAEVQSILDKGVETANRTRAVIRLPLGTRAKFVIAVTDTAGNLLGLRRMADSTIFSIDVAVTKARNVVWFSGAGTADLPGIPANTAVTNRTIGFGSQRFFPSGIANSSFGPFRSLYLNDIANPCTQGSQPKNANQSGIVFFPGSVPLYKNGRIVGGLGVSGDGVEQDDYVTAGAAAGFEAPPNARADNVFIRGVRLPYLKFPRNPEQ
jgi:uncharacterized protein GlcG (DUF336 family)